MFQLYYHGECINVNVHIANNSNRTVKKVKVAGKFRRFLYSLNVLVSLAYVVRRWLFTGI